MRKLKKRQQGIVVEPRLDFHTSLMLRVVKTH
jgi:hypothetical protein